MSGCERRLPAASLSGRSLFGDNGICLRLLPGSPSKRYGKTTQPTDTTKWVKIDSPPAITWKLNDAWIWVGTPAVVPMILNNAKVFNSLQQKLNHI
jgi:hypothetical protein